MYVPNYEAPGSYAITDQAIGNVRVGRPAKNLLNVMGLGQTPGESLVMTKLDILRDKWMALSGWPTSDYVGLQKNVNELKALRSEVARVISRPKSDAILKLLDEGILKQQKYVDEKRSISRAQDRFTEMRNTIKGVLGTPMVETAPAPAAAGLKSLIVPAAITAGVATIVGMIIRKTL